MQNPILPKLYTVHETQRYGKFQLKPLMRGYGTTLGVSLRRVLLSSLRGSAITAVRIHDIYHEFSAIPQVREDTTQLILNIREIELCSHVSKPVTLTLHVQSAGIYTAGDIQEHMDVEILNPDLYLLTADEDTELDLEMIVQRGYGYSPQEERVNMPPGYLPIDAVFSPIARAAFQVEDHRVGQQTDLDQVTLEVWTDGSIKPLQAMQEAAHTLVNHLAIVIQDSKGEAEIIEEEEEEKEPNQFSSSIEELDLNVRTYNCLKRVGIATLGELLHLMEKGRGEMLAIRNFGEKSLDELITQLRKKDLLHLPGVDLSEYLEEEVPAVPTDEGSDLEGEELDPVGPDQTAAIAS